MLRDGRTATAALFVVPVNPARLLGEAVQLQRETFQDRPVNLRRQTLLLPRRTGPSSVLAGEPGLDGSQPLTETMIDYYE
jgi:hypothetical protein